MAGRDYCSEEFKRLVILGESTVQGGSWLQGQDKRFPDVLVRLINSVQKEPVEYINEGVGASVISPRSTGYEDSNKPSAMERYRGRVIEQKPDLFIFCYGLNDMRCGTPIDVFIEDMETILNDVKEACGPVCVLTTVYHMTRFEWWAPFDVGSVEITKQYNAAIAKLAEEHDCILADVWAAQGLVDHVIHPDGVHANAAGSLLIANRIFEALVQNCSGLSKHIRGIDEGTDWARRCRKMNA